MASTLGCKDTRVVLQAAGVPLTSLDFVVCNGATQLWVTALRADSHQQAAAAAAAAAAGGKATATAQPPLELLYDEQYERHIEAGWDARAAKQVRNRQRACVAGRGREKAGGRGEPVARCSMLQYANGVRYGCFLAGLACAHFPQGVRSHGMTRT